MENEMFSLEELHYDLPEELIAQEPLPVRHESRLLRLGLGDGSVSHHVFSDLTELLETGDLIVVNDTRVIPARIYARRESGGAVELLLIKPRSRAGAPGGTIWEAMGTPLRRLKPGERLQAVTENGAELFVRVVDLETDRDGFKRVLIDLGSRENLETILKSAGHAPLPPYIRKERKEDLERYQTVFAAAPGAVAAPTAGLHFSGDLMQELEDRSIEIRTITLHVGPGTFKPITTSIEDHSIEPEIYSISPETATAINTAKEEGRRVIAVGTTSLRTLETAGASGRVSPAENAQTSLYVKPGHRFAIVDGLITNFHLSGSSLLVLVATFAGPEAVKKAYLEAVARRYRFFSYGDAMLII